MKKINFYFVIFMLMFISKFNFSNRVDLGEGVFGEIINREFIISGEGKIDKQKFREEYEKIKRQINSIKIEDSENEKGFNKVQFPDDSSNLFMYISSKIEFPNNMDTSNVTNMSNMFYDSYLSNPNVSEWDTSNVTNMSAMFRGLKLANPDVSKWDTSNVTNISYMFFGADLANPDVSKWDTSNVTNMSYIFGFAKSANPDVSNWDTSNVVRMDGVFYDANSAKPNLSKWKINKADIILNMFYNISDEAVVDLSKWKLKDDNMILEIFYDYGKIFGSVEEFESSLNEYIQNYAKFKIIGLENFKVNIESVGLPYTLNLVNGFNFKNLNQKQRDIARIVLAEIEKQGFDKEKLTKRYFIDNAVLNSLEFRNRTITDLKEVDKNLPKYSMYKKEMDTIRNEDVEYFDIDSPFKSELDELTSELNKENKETELEYDVNNVSTGKPGIKYGIFTEEKIKGRIKDIEDLNQKIFENRYSKYLKLIDYANYTNTDVLKNIDENIYLSGSLDKKEKGIRIGLHKDLSKELRVGVFGEYGKIMNNNQYIVGIDGRYKKVAGFVRYRKIEDYGLVDAYLKYSKDFKFNEKFTITPEVGIYATILPTNMTDIDRKAKISSKIGIVSDFGIKLMYVNKNIELYVKPSVKYVINKLYIQDKIIESTKIESSQKNLNYTLLAGIKKKFENNVSVQATIEIMPKNIKGEISVGYNW